MEIIINHYEIIGGVLITICGVLLCLGTNSNDNSNRPYYLIVLGVIAGLAAISCVSFGEDARQDAEEKASLVKLKIIESYVDDNGFKFFVLSDGDLIAVKKRSVTFFDNKGVEQDYTAENNSVGKWKNAEIGDIVYRKRRDNKLCYEVVFPLDTILMKTVSRIEASNENMLMNIFFEDGKAIVIDAKEHPSWLTVQKGDTVIQKRINGKTLFSPKY